MVTIENFNRISTLVHNIKVRKYVFTIFKLNESKTAYVEGLTMGRNIKGRQHETTEKFAHSRYEELSSSARDVPCEELLHQHFKEMLEHVDLTTCCYLVYDFGFYNANKAYRSVVCLIIYIPDDSNDTTNKFVYSSNSLTLKEQLGIGKHVVVNCRENLNYDFIMETCANFAKF
ncbi:hypothetical protein COBT_001781 [Conglomerata obtusa]